MTTWHRSTHQVSVFTQGQSKSQGHYQCHDTGIRQYRECCPADSEKDVFKLGRLCYSWNWVEELEFENDI